MTMTNYGNGYKFKAMMERRSHKEVAYVQRLKKDGTWGKPLPCEFYGEKTPEQVLARIQKNNPDSTYRLAE